MKYIIYIINFNSLDVPFNAGDMKEKLFENVETIRG